MDLHTDSLPAALATDKAAIDHAADVAEVRPEPRDQRLHVQVGAMPALLAHGAEAVIVRDQIAEVWMLMDCGMPQSKYGRRRKGSGTRNAGGGAMKKPRTDGVRCGASPPHTKSRNRRA